MKTIQSALKARLANKGLTQASLGAFAIEHAKQFAVQPNQLTGYIRANKLFLRGGKKENPTERFLKKKIILSTINAAYQKGGFEYALSDVRLTK